MKIYFCKVALQRDRRAASRSRAGPRSSPEGKPSKWRKECRLSASSHDGSPRIALVTGASRGIGRAAAIALAASGAHVVALARTQGGLEELDDEIRALRPEEPGATTLVPMDLRDFAAIDGWEKLSIAAGAGLTLLSATPACWACSPLSTTSTRRRGMTSWRSTSPPTGASSGRSTRCCAAPPPAGSRS